MATPDQPDDVLGEDDLSPLVELGIEEPVPDALEQADPVEDEEATVPATDTLEANEADVIESTQVIGYHDDDYR